MNSFSEDFHPCLEPCKKGRAVRFQQRQMLCWLSVCLEQNQNKGAIRWSWGQN